MCRLVSLLMVCLFAAAGLAGADIIYLKNGNAFEVEDAVIKGDWVFFTIYNGNMAVELTAVERIEKAPVTAAGSSRPGNTFAGLSSPAAGNNRFGAASGRPGNLGTETEGEQPGQGNDELTQFYISQKQQLEREIYFHKQNIQTLNSVIYANSVLFIDSTSERERISELQNLIEENQQRIEQLLREARLQGLLPGDIRKIENARFRAQAVGTQGATGAGVEENEQLYEEESEEPLYEEPEGEIPPGS